MGCVGRSLWPSGCVFSGESTGLLRRCSIATNVWDLAASVSPIVIAIACQHLSRFLLNLPRIFSDFV